MESLEERGARMTSFGARGTCASGGGKRLVEAWGAILICSRDKVGIGVSGRM